MLNWATEYQLIIRHALNDAQNYRLNHCRKTEWQNDAITAYEYEGAAYMLDSQQLIIITGDVGQARGLNDDELERLLRQVFKKEFDAIKPKGTLADLRNQIAQRNRET